MKTALRGYRAEEVDELLARCAATMGHRAAELPELAPYARGLGRPAAITADEVVATQFHVSFRGYAIDEVDDVLDRVAAALRRAV